MCEGEGNVLLHAHFLRNTDDLSEIAKEDLIYMLRNFTSLAEAEDEEDDNTGGTKEEEDEGSECSEEMDERKEGRKMCVSRAGNMVLVDVRDCRILSITSLS